MDNNNDINIDKTSEFINKTYENLSYFDLYGNSVIIFIFITLFVFLVYSYCKVMQTKEVIASDWVNQRCKPQNIAFAGQITHPDGVTPFEYTNENFQYCIQSILQNITGYALEPFQFMISALTEMFNEFGVAIQKIRELASSVRGSVGVFTEDVMSRILNIMTPIVTMFIALMDGFNKIQGVMVSGLYTMLGSYYTLQSLMGAILELVIKILVILVIVIVGLWILPFTWPVATTMTAVFLAVAIPLAIIIYFMTEILHVKASAIPQLKCFDKNTNINLANGKHKIIKEVVPGDILADGSIITAKIKISSDDLDMYNLNGIIVSECHIINFKDKWIPVKNHPNAIKLHNYEEPYLYCLNTSTKTINLNNIIFTDWDEIYEDTLEFILKYKSILKTEDISINLDYGFAEDTKIILKNENKNIKEYKKIKEINIGDILSTGGIVYGIVELNNLGNNNKLYHLLVSNKYFETTDKLEITDKLEPDYNNIIDSILELKKILSKEYV